MSFGSLSGNAIPELKRGAALAGCLQNTGEGGLSEHHRHGGNLTFQIGTAYFGCRDDKGRFSMGGMASKLSAVKFAVGAGIETHIAHGRHPERLAGIVAGIGISTKFHPAIAP